MALTDDLATPLANELLMCLCEQMAQVTDPPASCCLRNGDVVPWLMDATRDECCEGLAWVRVVTIFAGFPEPTLTVPISNEISNWSVTLEMGAVRCGPFSQLVPSCDEWTETTNRVLEDSYAMRQAFCCFVNGTHRQPNARHRRGSVIPGPWEPLETQGGCAGGTWLLTVRSLPCDCPPEEVS